MKYLNNKCSIKRIITRIPFDTKLLEFILSILDILDQIDKFSFFKKSLNKVFFVIEFG